MILEARNYWTNCKVTVPNAIVANPISNTREIPTSMSSKPHLPFTNVLVMYRRVTKVTCKTKKIPVNASADFPEYDEAPEAGADIM